MAATLDEIKSWTFALSGKDLADCMSPDSLESPGMGFLTSVRDATVELIESGNLDPEDDSHDNDNGEIHEIADAAPSVYTYTLWAEFADLGAYQEEPEYGEWPDDLNKVAGVALYQIAERLAHAIIREWREGLAEATGAEDEDEPTDA